MKESNYTIEVAFLHKSSVELERYQVVQVYECWRFVQIAQRWIDLAERLCGV